MRLAGTRRYCERVGHRADLIGLDQHGIRGMSVDRLLEAIKLRAEEIEAITKAIEIISGGAVAGNADKYLPALAQKTSSLAQLRSGRAPQQRAADYLRARGQSLNSRVLSALAVRVDADPFEKVKKMIKDLIVRLMEEALGDEMYTPMLF